MDSIYSHTFKQHAELQQSGKLNAAGKMFGVLLNGEKVIQNSLHNNSTFNYLNNIHSSNSSLFGSNSTQQSSYTLNYLNTWNSRSFSTNKTQSNNSNNSYLTHYQVNLSLNQVNNLGNSVNAPPSVNFSNFA